MMSIVQTGGAVQIGEISKLDTGLSLAHPLLVAFDWAFLDRRHLTPYDRVDVLCVLAHLGQALGVVIVTYNSMSVETVVQRRHMATLKHFMACQDLHDPTWQSRVSGAITYICTDDEVAELIGDLHQREGQR